MRLIGKEFMAALTALFTFPARLLGRPRVDGNRLKPISPRALLQPRLWLADWRQVRRMPLDASVHPIAQRLILAALRREMLRIRYWSGSTPGIARQITPIMVFQAGGYGPLYVSAYCHLRRQERVFRVDRVELLIETEGLVCVTE